MVAQVARHWWLPALRGTIAILFGVVALLRPGITLTFLIAFFGAFVFVDGVFALVSAVRFRHVTERWTPLLLEGILGIAVGVVTFFWPGLTALAWIYTIAVWAVITGILEIVAAVRLRGHVWTNVLLGLTGLASIVLGVLFALMPLAGLIVWVWLIGWYAIVFGIFLIAFALRMRTATEPVGAALGH